MYVAEKQTLVTIEGVPTIWNDFHGTFRSITYNCFVVNIQFDNTYT